MMATTMQSYANATSPISSSKRSNDLAELHDHLDSLWTLYLQHLDTYTTAQALLQRHMSAGCLSLARANFNSRGGVRRYGKDYYHDRAVASRRARISKLNDDEGRCRADIVRWDEDRKYSITDEVSNDDKDVEVAEQQQKLSSPPTCPDSSAGTDKTTTDPPLDKLSNLSVDTSTDATSNGDKSTELEIKAKTDIDPLRWFGILVPPELRKAQTSFTLAVEEAVAHAVNAAKRMRELEVEIRRVRKEVRRAEKAGGGG